MFGGMPQEWTVLGKTLAQNTCAHQAAAPVLAASRGWGGAELVRERGSEGCVRHRVLGVARVQQRPHAVPHGDRVMPFFSK